MTILITGGAGFIGSELIRHLIKHTNLNIVNIDCLTYAGNLNSLNEVEDSRRYTHELVNICDRESIKNVFEKYQPTGLIHLAAESHVDKSINDSNAFIQTNIIGTYNLLEESRHYYNKLIPVKKTKFRFQHVSTDEVYGDLEDTNSFFTEMTRYNPSSPYSASKASSDHLVRSWARTYGLPVIISNCSNNYGQFQFPEKLIPTIIINAITGKNIPVYGDGSQIRDWLFVGDHAEALVKLYFDGNIGETYNIGGNNEKKNIEVVNEVCQLLEKLLPNKPDNIINFTDLISFVDDRPGHDKRYAIDAKKIKNDLGWTPNESFSSGLEKTVKWYLENEDWWKRILANEIKN